MEIKGYAYFVAYPRIIDDLLAPHIFEAERPFVVAKIVKLAKIDYENFITDMVADRQFIEDHAAFCKMGKPGTVFWPSSAAALTACSSCRRISVMSAGRRTIAGKKKNKLYFACRLLYCL